MSALPLTRVERPSRCELVIYGTPRPQGSKSAAVVGTRIKVNGKPAIINPRGVVIDASSQTARDNLKAWRDAVAGEARLWLSRHPGHVPWDEALRMSVIFAVTRPPSISKKQRFPIGKPDNSKLLRAVEDSLSKIIYSDDARIVTHSVSKRYSPGSPFVTIRIEPMGDDE